MTGESVRPTLVVGYFGGGPQAAECLRRLMDGGACQIAFVHLRDEGDTALLEICATYKIPLLEARNINTPESLTLIEGYRPDLLVSVNAKQIFRPDLLTIPSVGSINVHNGLLPKQRGGGGAYTAIINGETPGTTVHFIDEGIDTGDILAQQEIPLTSEETMGDFQKKAITASAQILVEAIAALRSGTAVRSPQRHLPFHYTPSKAPWDELVDWSQPSKLILDKIRARTPGPANFYLYDDIQIEILEAEAEPNLLNFINTPGQVLQRDPARGVLVKTGDNGIWLRRIRHSGERTETIPDHRPGAMLRYIPDYEIYQLRSRVAALEKLVKDRP